MLVMMVLAFDVQVPNLPTFALTLAIASLSFLAIVFAMVKFLGDVGKVLAVLLLILQLSSAGALIPIELTNEFFQKISPYLPFTWVVRAFRATLFGAFDGDWLLPWVAVIGAGVSAIVGGILLGRYRLAMMRSTGRRSIPNNCSTLKAGSVHCNVFVMANTYQEVKSKAAILRFRPLFAVMSNIPSICPTNAAPLRNMEDAGFVSLASGQLMGPYKNGCRRPRRRFG